MVAADAAGVLSWEVVAAARVPAAVYARLPMWAGMDAVTTLRWWQADGLPVFGSSVPENRVEGQQVLVVFPAGAGYDLGMLDSGRADGVVVVPAINDRFRIVGIVPDHPEPGTTLVTLASAPHELVFTGTPWAPGQDASGPVAAAGAGTVAPTGGPATRSADGQGAGGEGVPSDVVPEERQLRHALGGWLDLRKQASTVVQQVRSHYLELRREGHGEREAATRTVTNLKDQGVIPADTEGTTIRLSAAQRWERAAGMAPDNARDGLGSDFLRLTELPLEVQQHLTSIFRDGPSVRATGRFGFSGW